MHGSFATNIAVLNASRWGKRDATILDNTLLDVQDDLRCNAFKLDRLVGAWVLGWDVKSFIVGSPIFAERCSSVMRWIDGSRR